MNNNNGLYFVVGGVCVVVVMVLLFGGHFGGHMGHMWHRGGETTTVEHHVPGGTETITRTERP